MEQAIDDKDHIERHVECKKDSVTKFVQDEIGVGQLGILAWQLAFIEIGAWCAQVRGCSLPMKRIKRFT